ncbi:Hypothetical protein A7982_07520 [Minicystis rosea]|nr:Hypothetical protein A7982_07520 [Minicystis rosea]
MDRRTEVLRRELFESLLMSYEHSSADGTFILITRQVAPDPGDDASFLRLTFTGVKAFVREPGSYRPYRDFVTSYFLAPDGPPLEIQSVRVGGSGVETSRVTLHFGSSFGDVSFSYASVIGHVRSARVVRKGGESLYFDAETVEPFDFYAPFGSSA